MRRRRRNGTWDMSQIVTNSHYGVSETTYAAAIHLPGHRLLVLCPQLIGFFLLAVWHGPTRKR